MNATINYSATICSNQKQPPAVPENNATSDVGLKITPFTSNDDAINEVSINDKKSRLASRSGIEKYITVLQELFGSETGEADKINEDGLEEHFIGGAYIRGLRIPKNVTIVSKLWTKERFWIIVSGEVTITTELWTKRVKAPYTAVAPYGSRVALYAHEETMWYAITGVDATDSETVEKEVFTKDHSGILDPWDLIEEH